MLNQNSCVLFCQSLDAPASRCPLGLLNMTFAAVLWYGTFPKLGGGGVTFSGSL